MNGFLATITSSIAQIAPTNWELLAVGLAIVYLLLAMKENSWCWLCAFISTIIYTVIFWNVNLLMDSALNIYYMVMAVYGWYQWNYGKHDNGNTALPIRCWSLQTHLLAGAAILVATLVSGYLLQINTQAAWPYLDSFTTWASVLTTYMVAKKILENWLYWIVIDAVAMLLYIERGLYPTAILFGAYVLIVIFGFFQWQKHFQAQELTQEQQHA